MKNNKILFFGPYPEPFTGQSISFRQVFGSFIGDKILFDTTRYEENKVLNSIYCFVCLPFVFFTRRFDKIYFTCTRSKLGFFKDFQLLLFARLFNKKVINHLHGADFIGFYENSGRLKKIIKWSYDKIDFNIVLLPSMQEQFEIFVNSNTVVVKNCFPSEFVESKVDLSVKKKQIIYLSNLIYSKGIFDFLNAANNFLESHKDAIVKIAGLPMGDENMSQKEVEIKFNKEFETLKLKHPKRVFYLGMVKGKEKEELLTESSVFILPTFYKTEAFPITIIEAMRFGNAIITTDHNYLKDVVNVNNGFIVQPNSSEGIVDKLEILFSNYKNLRKIQENNVSEALKHYSPQVFNEKINRIITQY